MTSRLAVQVTGGHVGALSCSGNKDAKRHKFLETILVDNSRPLLLLAANEGHEMFLREPIVLLREPPRTIATSRHLLRKVAEKSKAPIKLAIDTGHQCAAGVEEQDNDVYA